MVVLFPRVTFDHLPAALGVPVPSQTRKACCRSDHKAVGVELVVVAVAEVVRRDLDCVVVEADTLRLATAGPSSREVV